MKTVTDIFNDCVKAVEEGYGGYEGADVNAKLSAAVSLTELTMRKLAEENNDRRWQQSVMMVPQGPIQK